MFGCVDAVVYVLSHFYFCKLRVHLGDSMFRLCSTSRQYSIVK